MLQSEALAPKLYCRAPVSSAYELRYLVNVDLTGANGIGVVTTGVSRHLVLAVPTSRSSENIT